MEKKLFAELVQSMIQHNEILAGTREPSRVTVITDEGVIITLGDSFADIAKSKKTLRQS